MRYFSIYCKLKLLHDGKLVPLKQSAHVEQK